MKISKGFEYNVFQKFKTSKKFNDFDDYEEIS